ncbi:Apelin receptor [Varanus komodoensis]|nr:Apelin receptor [Varanus komodoensis]
MAQAQHPAEYAGYAYEDYEGSGNWSAALECPWDEADVDWEASFSLLPVLYMLVFVLGLSGNGLVIFTVWRGAPAKRRAADTYIGNLALADLAFVVTLPLWAAYTALRFHWPFGAALCKLSSYLCDLDLSGVARGPAEEARWLAGLSLATTALGFALPLLLMTLCYCAIGATVSRHFQRRARQEEAPRRRRLLRIIAALVAVFALCWLPFHALKGLYVLHWAGQLRLPCDWLALILRLHPYATCLAYVNSCLNPFLYAFFDGRFRAQCLQLLGVRPALRGQAGSVSSTLSGQTQKSEVASSGTKV